MSNTECYHRYLVNTYTHFIMTDTNHHLLESTYITDDIIELVCDNSLKPRTSWDMHMGRMLGISIRAEFMGQK